MEDFQEVLVSKAFLTTTHGKISCIECHSGSSGNNRALAHKEMIISPSQGENSSCSSCHNKIATNFTNTLHYTTKAVSDPKASVIAARSNPQKTDLLTKGLSNNCSTCHVTTCGECHISRPKTTGGGFVDGHNFYKTPKSVLNCTACHGSRLEKEYMGKAAEDYPDLKADVHWIPNSMQCTDCHTQEWIHNDQPTAENRYKAVNAPKCANCHTGKQEFKSIPAHQKHALQQNGSSLLQCQTCHSQPYNNCYSCHVGVDKKNLPYYKTDKSEFAFKIGRNPAKTPENPFDYTIVRHVPVARDTFDFYGKDLLSNFDAQPTWKYATPHNIQRVTPQGQCNGCHGNENIFLTAKDVLPEEIKANEKVIVTKIPPKF